MSEPLATAKPASAASHFSIPITARQSPRRKSSWPKWLFAAIVLSSASYGGFRYFSRPAQGPLEFKTAKITRGDIIQTITANGQLTPVKNVQVGSQISGTITEINADFNSKVKEGEIIARIDPATYERGLAQAEAELANAAAARALAQLNFKRSKELFLNNLISESEYNQAEVNLQQADAVVKMRESNVERAKVDLGRTIIYAPIDGVVISRSIEVGQTVAASFNTPTLFLIANNLSKMQIEAAISEADVGGVEAGQEVTFTVEAFPAREFKGKVNQVRYAPTTNQNVVTYTTIVEVDNPDLKLRPGMTANASVITSKKQGVLRIPNAALRFRPPDGAAVKTAPSAAPASGESNPPSAGSADSDELPTPPWMSERRRPTPEEREKYEASLTPQQQEKYRQLREQMRARFAEGGGPPSGPGGGAAGGVMRSGGMAGLSFGAPSAARPAQEGPRTQTVYLIEKETDAAGKPAQILKAVTIKVGSTDGTNTEVIEGIEEGVEIVSGMALSSSGNVAARSAPSGSSPFGGPFGPGRR